jgi:hypothetical protein
MRMEKKSYTRELKEECGEGGTKRRKEKHGTKRG